MNNEQTAAVYDLCLALFRWRCRTSDTAEPSQPSYDTVAFTSGIAGHSVLEPVGSEAKPLGLEDGALPEWQGVKICCSLSDNCQLLKAAPYVIRADSQYYFSPGPIILGLDKS
ncbi:hypothetical protein N7492_000880 [Penicillium capsulatum]|uniref:Uncharacterized protein n=1 Tax=Penicillium capsulatum TaxID=69766 RepID=A0A9W9LZU3_9EURO|nr:hypothetical protein N7492_000880 [Penicillium capsulatum]KAJ6130064.1 hypothetical protein N7512_002844 [Penicillium capsulatum]